MHTNCGGRYKSYLLCANDDDHRDRVLRQWKSMEEELEKASEELSKNGGGWEISEKAATAAKELQLELIEKISEHLIKIENSYHNVGGKVAELDERQFLRQCKGIFDNIVVHMKEEEKSGASLQVRLGEIVQRR